LEKRGAQTRSSQFGWEEHPGRCLVPKYDTDSVKARIPQPGPDPRTGPEGGQKGRGRSGARPWSSGASRPGPAGKATSPPFWRSTWCSPADAPHCRNVDLVGLGLAPGSPGGDRENGRAPTTRVPISTRAGDGGGWRLRRVTSSPARPTSTCSSRSARKTWSDGLARRGAGTPCGSPTFCLGSGRGSAALHSAHSACSPAHVKLSPAHRRSKRVVGDVGEAVVQAETRTAGAPCA